MSGAARQIDDDERHRDGEHSAGNPVEKLHRDQQIGIRHEAE